MSKIFTHTAGYVIYEDTSLTNNPSKQFGNWKRSNYNIEVTKPSGPQELQILPGATVTAFSGTRSLGFGSNSQFALTLNPVLTDTYRLTYDGASTFSGFRTARSASLLVGNPITITINNAALATFSSAINISAIISVGDTIFIPATSTGDSASPFSESNVGYWQVVAVGTTTFQAKRLPGETFNGAAEVVTTANPNEFQVFSNGPTLVGDTFRLDAGNINSTFQITALTADWIEFVSATPLPLNNTIIVGELGLTVFSYAKRWVRIETDSSIVLQFNNSTDDTLTIVPRATLSDQVVGWFDSWGFFWKLNIVNESLTNTCNIVISTLE